MSGKGVARAKWSWVLPGRDLSFFAVFTPDSCVHELLPRVEAGRGI